MHAHVRRLPPGPVDLTAVPTDEQPGLDLEEQRCLLDESPVS